MARHKHSDKYQAILEAAIAAFASDGFWNTPTAQISRGAAIADGTLFTYFKSKDDLITEVYITIKRTLATYVLEDVTTLDSVHAKLAYIWRRYIEWGLNNPTKHTVLQQISATYKLSELAKAQGNEPFEAVASLADESIQRGEIVDVPIAYLAAYMDSFANMTIRFIQTHEWPSEECIAVGFEMFWKSTTR